MSDETMYERVSKRAAWCEVCGFELDQHGVCAECGWDGYSFLTRQDDDFFEPDAEEIALLGDDESEADDE